MQYGVDNLTNRVVARRNENAMYASKTRIGSEVDASLRMQDETTDAGD